MCKYVRAELKQIKEQQRKLREYIFTVVTCDLNAYNKLNHEHSINKAYTPTLTYIYKYTPIYIYIYTHTHTQIIFTEEVLQMPA